MAMAIGPLAEVSAYAFAPQSLLAPLDGFDVIWNILPKTQVAARLPKTLDISNPMQREWLLCYWEACALHFG